MRVAVYVRISTTSKKQDTSNQLNVLSEYCDLMKYQITDIYKDEMSGGTSERPAYKKLFQDARKRKFDLVLFWSLDRWSREGTRATIKSLELLESYGVAYKSYTEQYIDSAGIFKDVIISLLSTLARQEKIRISERVKAGISRSDKKSGRPKLESTVIHQIKEFKKKGYSNRKIGKELNISHSTVGQYLTQAA